MIGSPPQGFHPVTAPFSCILYIRVLCPKSRQPQNAIGRGTLLENVPVEVSFLSLLGRGCPLPAFFHGISGRLGAHFSGLPPHSPPRFLSLVRPPANPHIPSQVQLLFFFLHFPVFWLQDPLLSSTTVTPFSAFKSHGFAHSGTVFSPPQSLRQRKASKQNLTKRSPSTRFIQFHMFLPLLLFLIITKGISWTFSIGRCPCSFFRSIAPF